MDKKTQPTARVGLSFPLSYVHKLDEANEFVFHGHSTTITLVFEGPIDSESGWIINQPKIKKTFEQKYLPLWHQTILNHHQKFTSGEWLAQTIFSTLVKDSLFSQHLQQITLQETDKNSFTFPAP